MIDRLEAESRLGEIQAQRTVLFDQHRAATLPEPELFERLRRLDTEETFWRTRIKHEERPAPETLPPWGKELWMQVLRLSAEVDAWRDERRSERISDARERDRARWQLSIWLGVLTAAAFGQMFVVVWIIAEVFR